MAYIGLKKPIIGKRTGAKKYDTPAALGKAVSMNITVNYNEASLYGDDALAEYDKYFKDADITLGTTTIPLEMNEIMFGHTVDDAEKTVTSNSNDENNYVGVGIMSVEKNNGETSYIAMFMYKVKFSEPSTEFTTRGDSIEYKTPSISGKASSEDDGVWKMTKTFSSEADALKWIYTQFGSTVPAEG